MNAKPAADAELVAQAMRRALRLAARGRGWTSPNPMVGAVILKDGRVIGEGWHARVGHPHAERAALEDCRVRGENTAGATMVVTLEPCNHFGRTPPCTDGIIEAGIARVVIAHEDPNPRVNGAGVRRLTNAGVAVETGPFGREAVALNEMYCRYICAGRPFVTLKAAITLDGKIAAAGGDSRWVSGPPARRYAHWLRHTHDGILVGVNTVLADDPSLTCRLPSDRPYRQPLRIVLDSRLRTLPSCNVVAGRLPGKTLVACTKFAPEAAVARLAKPNVMVEIFPADEHGDVELPALLRWLRGHEIGSILVEGGGHVHASFLRSRMADKLALALAPKILGGAGAISWVAGELAGAMREARLVRDLTARRLGGDLLIEGRLEDIGECLLV